MKILREGKNGFDRYLSKVEGRVAQDGFRLEKGVRSILKDVRKRGDRALVYYTQIFDGLRIPVHQLQVKRSEVREAYRNVPREFLGTLEQATRRIRKFHQLLSKRLIPTLKGEERGIRLE